MDSLDSRQNLSLSVNIWILFLRIFVLDLSQVPCHKHYAQCRFGLSNHMKANLLMRETRGQFLELPELPYLTLPRLS